MLRQIKNSRPTFRTSSTYFCLPSITFITEVASARGDRAGAHQEGQSSVIIWADWWTLRPELLPVNDYSANSVPIVPSPNSSTTMNLYPYAPSNSSNSNRSDGLLMRTIDLRDSETLIQTQGDDYEYEAVTDDGGHSDIYGDTSTTGVDYISEGVSSDNGKSKDQRSLFVNAVKKLLLVPSSRKRNTTATLGASNEPGVRPGRKRSSPITL